MSELTSNALAVIDKARANGALIYAPQNLECPALYKAEATAISARPDEFHNIQGKFLPNRAVVDRIAEASGIDFIPEQCQVTTRKEDDFLGKRTIHIGHAQGRVRLPDGSWRHSAVEEYEWDPLLRAEMDARGDDSKKRRLTLEFMKVSAQRAATGARLRVIRALTGIPATFTESEIKKPMVFSRIVQNTDYILGTKEGRTMAIAAATGLAGQLFGQAPMITQGPGADAPAEALQANTEDPIHTDHEVMDDDFTSASDAFDSALDRPDDLRDMYRQALRDYQRKYDFGKQGNAIVEATIANQGASAEELKALCDKIKSKVDTGAANPKEMAS